MTNPSPHNKRRAVITGITGQDGSYLAELLLEKGYEVHGLVRRVAIEAPEQRMARIRHLLGALHLHPTGLDSYPGVYRAISHIRPDECYHLAAQSYAGGEFEDDYATLTTNISGTHYVLSAIKDACPACRFYFAASSEVFGNIDVTPQDELTRFHPRTAYGISKVAGFDLTRNYREAYGLFAASGILYNHESPRRGYEFVSRKITSHAARIRLGLATELRLGDLAARRDWGHARDSVRAMWLMLQRPAPADYVVATGVSHSVRDFCEAAFGVVGLDYRAHVVSDPRFVRSTDVATLVGNPARARAELGWSPRIGFGEMVREMVEHDLESARGSLSVPPALPPLMPSATPRPEVFVAPPPLPPQPGVRGNGAQVR